MRIAIAYLGSNHFFGDVGDLALQLVEPPHLTLRDAVEDDRCPFVTDQVEDAPSRKAEIIGAGAVFSAHVCVAQVSGICGRVPYAVSCR